MEEKKHLIRRIGPAIPTVLVAGLLAIDFNDILNQLYLSILVYYPITVILLVVGIIIGQIKREQAPWLRSVFLLLFMGSILLPVFEYPTRLLIEKFTAWNRAFAVVDVTFMKESTFDFTFTGHGRGSYGKFDLRTGYCNIAMNQEYGKGPSLRYKFDPTTTIQTSSGYKAFDEDSLKEVLLEKELVELMDPETLSIVHRVIESMSEVHSETEFQSQFSTYPDASIVMMADENAVYRGAFTMISLIAIGLSFRLTKE